jgi:hypothetical protein
MGQRQIAALAALLLLGGCDVVQIGKDLPTDAAFLASLQTIERRPFLDASVGLCHAGELDGHQVQACRICLVTVKLDYTNRVGSLYAVRSTGSAAFYRAVSADQPGIEAAPGTPGVWLVASSTIEVEESRPARFTESQMQRAGYARRSPQGWRALSSKRSPWGERLPDVVLARMAADAALRDEVVTLTEGCSSTRSREAARPPLPEPEPPVVQGRAGHILPGFDDLGAYVWFATMPADAPVSSGITQRITNTTREEQRLVITGQLTDAAGARATIKYEIVPATQVAETSAHVTIILTSVPGRTETEATLTALATRIRDGSLPDLQRVMRARLRTIDFDAVAIESSRTIAYVESCSTDGWEAADNTAHGLSIVRLQLSRQRVTLGNPIVLREATNGDYCIRSGFAFTGARPRIVEPTIASLPSGSALHIRYQGDRTEVMSAYEQLEAVASTGRLHLTLPYEILHDDGMSEQVDRDIYYLVDTPAVQRFQAVLQLAQGSQSAL